MNRCPFGPALERYWARLAPEERRMQLDEQALYSLTPQSLAVELAARISGKTVIDAMCGAGGDAIGFARAGLSVIAVDSNGARLEMARRNAELFGVSNRIEFVCADAREVLRSRPADTAYLDPPWGGVDYGQKSSFVLADFSPAGSELLDAALAVTPSVLMKLPKNFDLEEFTRAGISSVVCEHSIDGKLCFLSALLSRRGR